MQTTHPTYCTIVPLVPLLFRKNNSAKLSSAFEIHLYEVYILEKEHSELVLCRFVLDLEANEALFHGK